MTDIAGDGQTARICARANAVEMSAVALCDAQLGAGVWASLWDNQKAKWLANAEIQIAAYLAAMFAAGYAVVPREATEAMVVAAAQLDFSAQQDPTWPEYYRAMIAAAEPTP